MATANNETITYQKIPVSKSYEVSQLLLNSFFKEEPLGLQLGLTLDQVSRWIPKYIESAIEQNASIMAVAMSPAAELEDEPQTETMVGVCVNISESLDILNFIDKSLEPNMWNVGQYLHLLEQSIVNHPGANQKTLHSLFLNVLIGYAGRGIAKTLALKSEELARDAGFDCLEVETTSEFSYRVYKNMNYIIIGQLPYDEFADENGESLIKNVDRVHTCGRVMWKQLSL